MRQLHFIADRQTLEKSEDCDFDNIVRGSIGYLYACFTFLDDWQNTTRIVTFYSEDNDEYAVVYNNAPVEIPQSVVSCGHFGVKVTGVKSNYKIETNAVWVRQK